MTLILSIKLISEIKYLHKEIFVSCMYIIDRIVIYLEANVIIYTSFVKIVSYFLPGNISNLLLLLVITVDFIEKTRLFDNRIMYCNTISIILSF